MTLTGNPARSPGIYAEHMEASRIDQLRYETPQGSCELQNRGTAVSRFPREAFRYVLDQAASADASFAARMPSASSTVQRIMPPTANMRIRTLIPTRSLAKE